MTVLPILSTVILAACGDLASGLSPLRNPVLVVGSMNADFTMKVGRLPHSGENIVGHSTWSELICGGKGLNQAVAASKLQNPDLRAGVQFVGQFGNDVHAAALEKCLTESNVDIAGSGRADTSSSVPSGQGYVFLQDDGTVSAVVVGGSNTMWPSNPVTTSLQAQISRSGAVMLQREVPEYVNAAIVTEAHAAGVPVFLDIGGEDRPISDELLAKVSFVAPNLPELARLTKLPVDTDENILLAARSLQARGANAVLVTLGSDGALLLTADKKVLKQAVYPIPGGVVVDETGAGDTFRAAFAVAYAEGQSLEASLEFASAAGACAVSKHGAASSLPSRMDVMAVHSKGASKKNTTSSCVSADTCTSQMTASVPVGQVSPLPKFASRLNSMTERKELWSGTDDVSGWIARQGTVKGLDLVDLNFPQHFESSELTHVEVAQKLSAAVKAAGLNVGAINMRYPKKFRNGAFSNPDAALRSEAVKLTIDGGEVAKIFGAQELIVWSAFDGYDYHLQVDYSALLQRTVVSYQEVCDALPSIKVSFEYKPTDPSSRFAVAGSAGAALLLARDVDRPNMGVTLDVGHCLMAGENPAQSAALLGDRLFGVHLNDGHSRIGAEDGLMVGSVHPTQLLELMYWLQKISYQGHLYMDTFPQNEDPVREAAFNIRRTTSFWERASTLRDAGELQSMLMAHDALGVMELLEPINQKV